jgi:hypothetical protein
LLRNEQLSACVHCKHTLEFLGRDLGDVSEALDTRGGDYDVDLLEVVLGFREEFFDRGRFRDVGLDGDCVAAHALMDETTASAADGDE